MGSLVIKQKPQCQTHIVWGWDLCAPKSFPKPHVSGFWFLSSVYILYCLILFAGHHSRVEVGEELKNSNQCQKQQAMPILIFKISVIRSRRSTDNKATYDGLLYLSQNV